MQLPAYVFSCQRTTRCHPGLDPGSITIYEEFKTAFGEAALKQNKKRCF